nr:uncharacterized protein LOC117989764 [Maniola hyperantus]
MHLHSCRCSCYNVVVFFGILLLSKPRHGKCNPITNSNLSEDIREFAVKEDNNSTNNVKTLQKEDQKRYTDIVSFRPITFKEVPDSKQSSSSYGRGLVSREHPGYALHEYEEYPHINYGYDYHLPDSHHHEFDHHDFRPHHGYYDGHHVGHHRYYNHALATKAVLWPIAGIALLGAAAAALVSNPILLQLGVASGKRRRRNTEEITGPELSTEITEWRPLINRKVAAIKTGTHSKAAKTKLVHRKAKRNEYTSTTQRINTKRTPMTELHIEGSNSPLDEESDELNFIPISITNKDD